MLTIKNKFGHGDTVYLVTDPEQLPGLVFCIEVYPNETMYRVTRGTETNTHYDFELSREKNVLLKVTS